MFINEDGILNRVAIDKVIPVQKYPKDGKQAINTDYRSPTKTASTPYHETKDAKQGDNDKKVK